MASLSPRLQGIHGYTVICLGSYSSPISQSGCETEEEGWVYRKVKEPRKERQGAPDMRTYVDGYTGWGKRSLYLTEQNWSSPSLELDQEAMHL